MLIGVAGTLLWQWCVGSIPVRMATVPSPDGWYVFIVDRFPETWSGPAYRTFRICERDDNSPVDGAIDVEHEYASGGINMDHMTTYWRGDTAVADFGGGRLERKLHGNTDWQWRSDPAPATSSRPTTRE